MEYQDYNSWQREQVLDPSWTDHHDNPVTDDMKGQFVTIEKALSVKAKVDRDLKVSSTLSIDPMYKSKTASYRWLLTFNSPNGTPVTASVGTIFAEMSQPTGWADSDKRNFYIGVGAPGRLDWDPAGTISSDNLPIAWIPQAKPAPEAPVPGSTVTSWSSLANTSGGFDNGNFSALDRATLQRIAKALGV